MKMDAKDNSGHRVPITDAECYAQRNSAKLATLVTFAGSSPKMAGQVIATMGLSDVEVKALVTQAIVEGTPFQEAADAMCSLLPSVEVWRRRPEVARVFGEQAEAVGLLWAWVVAFGWVCDRGLA